MMCCWCKYSNALAIFRPKRQEIYFFFSHKFQNEIRRIAFEWNGWRYLKSDLLDGGQIQFRPRAPVIFQRHVQRAQRSQLENQSQWFCAQTDQRHNVRVAQRQQNSQLLTGCHVGFAGVLQRIAVPLIAGRLKTIEF